MFISHDRKKKNKGRKDAFAKELLESSRVERDRDQVIKRDITPTPVNAPQPQPPTTSTTHHA
ncbi:predicted protein [Sclerotinia sclerotiorum 1980 UF-70]|uniref:Uncharacterized protein n=2 Tax=Sclerotinia sclerotiorum (strain ATCC 18683 / 1980 / Ss-1) TaxID=665079 RepID=A7EN61_SCLS1|nr:predicted protein [Sclerotinia sclerotiorum 1980 UF-70]APA14751.1 hypothetical protein sscle_13g095210 [Sclerotinia sclerotiorum 1980 UF-70]EDO04277.1 predicted protein [Sclerotinia sclerotiorum 1980 UF-70]